ncbi:MAG: hypothetical protein IBX72_15150 [Nitrospirae bacterium]|nr:hypothetical protein [Nitrospirota bacterium]
MTLELSDKERELLKDILQLALGDLREEIVKTEASKWKPLLHDEEDTLRKIIQKLS